MGIGKIYTPLINDRLKLNSLNFLFILNNYLFSHTILESNLPEIHTFVP
jgi:hypothetical protein